jgi:hypothetical protein
MNETASVCDRCGSPIVRASARVLIESGPLHSGFPKLDLCGHCSESLEHWLAKRRVELRGGWNSGPVPHPGAHGGGPGPSQFAPDTHLVSAAPSNNGVSQALIVLAMSVAALFVLLLTMSLNQ